MKAIGIAAHSAVTREVGGTSLVEVGISWWIDFYDQQRPHSSLDGRTPNEAYTGSEPGLRPASLQPQAA